MTSRFVYLGPEGTFTEAALRSLPEAHGAALVPQPTVPAALDAVRYGEADGAMVPVENSVEGAVPSTLDELASGKPLLITAEVMLPITLSLLGRPGTRIEDVKRVVTHPHAHAQCRAWLSRHLPDAEVLVAASTAGAAAAVAEEGSPYDAAIAAPIAAERYRLAILAEGIGDRADAVTRFVLLRPPGPLPAPTGADRTSVVAFIADDHPGALLEILTEFAVRGVNLTWIQSRPTGERLGKYCFSIDCEGHAADARVGEALTGLRRICADVRFLGSFPRGDGARPRIRAGTRDVDFAAAEGWLAGIRRGRV